MDALRDYFMDNLTASRVLVEEDVQATESESLQTLRALSARFPTQETSEVTDAEDDPSHVPKEQRGKSPESSTENSEEEETPDISKRYHELFKLYPASYARELLRNTQHHQHRRLTFDDLQEDGPLLPGQSRTRRVVNSNDVRDIRGDSESDDSEVEPSREYICDGDIRNFLDYGARPEPASGLSWDGDAQSAGPSQPTIHTPLASGAESVEILDEDNTSSEEEQVDEEDIQALLGDDDAGTIYEADAGCGIVKEESMIDWMLSRTRIVGSTISKARAGGRRQSRPQVGGQTRDGGNARKRYKLDVTTRDARKFRSERQTLLSFENHATRKNTKNDKPRGMVKFHRNCVYTRVLI